MSELRINYTKYYLSLWIWFFLYLLVETTHKKYDYYFDIFGVSEPLLFLVNWITHKKKAKYELNESSVIVDVNCVMFMDDITSNKIVIIKVNNIIFVSLWMYLVVRN